uniref:trace amine-associated receptor 13c-like n=1 Tax=Scatophagus argus TaxID=75038 RepID=UPI001ED7DC68|nr:trace amine-associated receptor 13c-like [Scatophagus argus]
MMKTLDGAELCFPQLNSSCKKNMHSHSVSILTYTMLFSISMLTVTLNLLVIISVSHFRQLHTPTNFLLLSLAVSDCFVGFLMVFQIILIDGCWFLGDHMCIVYSVLAYIVTSTSVGTMVLISVDRYVAICDPLHYTTKVTQKRVKFCICLCWMCSAFCHILLLKDNLKQPGRYNSCTGECVIVVDYVSGLTDLFVSFIGPVTVIVVLYMRVFVVAVSQARAMRSHLVAVAFQHSETVTARKSEMKAATTLGVVVVVFLMCVCTYFWVSLTDQDTTLNASTSAFIICLCYFNSCLNPLIYAFFYSWFRKSIKLIITLKILQADSRDINMQ